MASELDRPAVLTPKAQRTIVEALANGGYLTTACTLAGITVETFYYWRRLCESGVEHAQKYADFFSAVKKATAKAENEALETIRAGASGWQSSAWFLERRFYKRWGDKAKQQEKRDTSAAEWDAAMDKLNQRLDAEPPEDDSDA